MPAVGQQGVHDAGEHRDQPGREQGIAQPVDLGRDADPVVAEPEVGPDRAEQAERNRHQEDQPPLHRGQHAAEDEAEERAGDRGDAVDPIAFPRSSWGKASVMIAVELANRKAPPTP